MDDRDDYWFDYQDHPMNNAESSFYDNDTTSPVWETVAAYLGQGWALTPVEPGTKRPVRKGWQNEAPLSAEALRPYFARLDPRNIGLRTGKPSGDVIDADFDDDGAVVAGAHFMPDTPAVFGRRSKRRSHRLYRCALKTAKFADPVIEGTDDERKMLLELRADGHQTVLPGSVHPSGEAIEWDDEGNPAQVDAAVLLAAAGKTAAAALLGRYWDGNRQDKAMALFGGLLGAGWSEDDAKRFVAAVCDVAGDEETGDRLKTGGYTAEKLTSGQPATGWPRLAELIGAGGDKLVEEIRNWLSARGVGSKGGQSQATLLVGLATEAGATLFHDEQEVPFATFPVAGHHETWRVGSPRFQDWLTERFMDARGGAVPGRNAVQEAIHALAARARIKGERRAVWLRAAEFDGAMHLDLGDDAWRAVRIDRAGWDIVPHPPGLFRRSRTMQPLPEPIRGGSLDDLRRFVNVASDDDWTLVVGWLIQAIVPAEAYPVLQLSGEQGAAKTTFARVLRRIVDPNSALTLAAPAGEQNLRVSAYHNHVLVFDNLSSISVDLSDAFCRLSTGGGFATRALYTDDEEVVFEGQRPMVFTGINEVGTKSDLLDRSLLIRLPKIPDEKRMPEKVFWNEFEAALPSILGALCDAVSTGLARVSEVTGDRWPRMADFAKWVEAAAPALGWEPGAFRDACFANRNEAHRIAVDSSTFASAVIRFMEGTSEWKGTATELLDKVSFRAEGVSNPERAPDWPRHANGVTAQLGRLAPNLQAFGIDVQTGRAAGTGRRLITLTNARPNPAKVKAETAPFEVMAGIARPCDDEPAS